MSLIQQIEGTYGVKKDAPGDINEHLPTLFEYSKNCNKIVECGVRSCVSSWAFLNGLIKNDNGVDKTLIQVDIDNNNLVQTFGDIAKDVIKEYKFYHQSDLECPLEKCDLLFIDTYHIYGQLIRELERWHAYVGKWIIMHDTEIDKYEGQVRRTSFNYEEVAKSLNWDIKDVICGLKPAIDEFINNHPEWEIEKVYTNNNGLTILRRKDTRK